MGKRQSDKSRQRLARDKASTSLAESPLMKMTLPFLGALFLVSLLPRIQSHFVLSRSFYFAIGGLLIWFGVLAWKVSADGTPLEVEFVPRRQHYFQACFHTSIFLYWGWYWRVVYDSALLIFAQILFAYAFDSLLSFSRRRKFVLGFGPFPIIFSTNLFLWFKDDWFYLQFIMLSVGFLAKEFIRWERFGQRVHVFNPSALSLSVFSFGLAILGKTDITRAFRSPELFSCRPIFTSSCS